MKKENIKDVVRASITEDMLIEHYDGISNGAKFISKWYMKEIKSTIFVWWYYEDINGVMCDSSRKQAKEIHYTAEFDVDIDTVHLRNTIEIADTDFEEKGTEKMFADFKELIIDPISENK